MADERGVTVGRVQEGDEPATALLERLHDPPGSSPCPMGCSRSSSPCWCWRSTSPSSTQGHSLNEALAEVRPSFNAFVVTFIPTGMYWVGHRDLFALIRRTTAAWSGSTSVPAAAMPTAVRRRHAGRLRAGTGSPADLRPSLNGDWDHATGHLAVRHQPAGPAVAAADARQRRAGWPWECSRSWPTCLPSWSPGARRA